MHIYEISKKNISMFKSQNRRLQTNRINKSLNYNWLCTEKSHVYIFVLSDYIYRVFVFELYGFRSSYIKDYNAADERLLCEHVYSMSIFAIYIYMIAV